MSCKWAGLTISRHAAERYATRIERIELITPMAMTYANKRIREQLWKARQIDDFTCTEGQIALALDYCVAYVRNGVVTTVVSWHQHEMVRRKNRRRPLPKKRKADK